jgi:predicted amidophosphoribosyltransferase
MITLDRVFGLLAPHQCLACGFEGSLLCDRCMETAGESIVPRCVGCHKLSDSFSTCHTCKKWLIVERVAVSTAYEGIYEDLLFAMKFDSKRQATDSIARIMSGSDLFCRQILCSALFQRHLRVYAIEVLTILN